MLQPHRVVFSLCPSIGGNSKQGWPGRKYASFFVLHSTAKERERERDRESEPWRNCQVSCRFLHVFCLTCLYAALSHGLFASSSRARRELAACLVPSFSRAFRELVASSWILCCPSSSRVREKMPKARERLAKGSRKTPPRKKKCHRRAREQLKINQFGMNFWARAELAKSSRKARDAPYVVEFPQCLSPKIRKQLSLSF